MVASPDLEEQGDRIHLGMEIQRWEATKAAKMQV
jgi:hypothetical protein